MQLCCLFLSVVMACMYCTCITLTNLWHFSDLLCFEIAVVDVCVCVLSVTCETFMLPPESAFCSNHDRKRTFLGCVHAYFAKAFWNADSKRRSKTPFTEVLFMLPSRRRRYVYRRRHDSEFSECLIQAIVRAQVNRKGVYMTSFKRGYNVILRSCFHQNQRFALTTFVNAHFWAFWIGVLKRVYSKISMDASVLL